MIDGLDNWQCPECGYIPEGMMDVVDTPDGKEDGSICPACKRFIATKDWIILSEDELLDALGFGGMTDEDFEEHEDDSAFFIEHHDEREDNPAKRDYHNRNSDLDLLDTD